MGFANRLQLNPVLYVEKESNLAISYLKVYNKFITNSGKQLQQLGDEEKAIIDILRYIKNYQNDLVRGGMVYNNYRFSDEREWRYVLDYNKPPQFIYAIQQFNKEAANSSLLDYRLEFEPNDIKYVIIQSEDEISEFVEVLRHAKGVKYSYHDVERLMTRIITTEQIVHDL